MLKSGLTALCAFLILFASAFYEYKTVNDTFDKFAKIIEQTQTKIASGDYLSEDGLTVEKFWLEAKKKLHVWIPHTDIKEIDLWVCECKQYTRQKNTEEAICKLAVLHGLATQVPYGFLIKFENIF